ncbi:MAG: mercury resistance system transport protein MerF [Devosiaceae bacterium]|nr:mercury resistance system transport protein MerF [Devosiaceae bacterium]
MTQDNINQQNKPSSKMLKTGLAGSLIAAICCFTPILVIAFVGAGLGGLVGGLDYFLFPMLFASLGLVAQSLYLNSNQTSPSPKWIIVALVVILSTILFVLQFRLAITLAAVAAIAVALYWLYLRPKSKSAQIN